MFPHKLSVPHLVQKPTKFSLQYIQINMRGGSTYKIRHLAINAMPVAGIVWIKIDANGNAGGSAGDHRIHIMQAGGIAVVVINA